MARRGAVRRIAAWAALACALQCGGASPAEALEDSFEEAPAPEISLLPDPVPAVPPAEVPTEAEAAPEPDYFLRHREEFYRDTPGAAAETGAGTPLPPDSIDGWAAGLQAFFVLCVLCGIIILGGYLLRRFGKNTPLLAGGRLGEVIGRVHLAPRASLHYVRTGGRVLVVGVTPNAIHTVAEFDAEAFADEAPEAAAPDAPVDFLAQLKSAQASPKPGDDDLGALRSEVQQLQAYLRGRGGPDA